MSFKVLIVDGYTDEPAGLGVPPYLDVYARYIAGALFEACKDCQVLYFTIDEVRSNFNNFLEIASRSKLLVFISGVVVPGKYLGGRPATLIDIRKVGEAIEGPIKALCGPVAKFGFAKQGGAIAKPLPKNVANLYDLVIKGDPEEVIYDLALSNFEISKADPNVIREDYDHVDRFAVKGAKIVLDHPNYQGNLICEIETFRGCPRWFIGGCSFCIEPLYGQPCFRKVEGVIKEIEALHSLGVVNFRIGRQPDILAYEAKGIGDVEFPEPNIEAIKKLFVGIRCAAPSLKVLHIDNVNPGTIAYNEETAKEALKVIVENHTSGDVAAMGIESVDSRVVKLNNLKVEYEDALKAIEIVNLVGNIRGDNGLPHLLPGVNFVYGLAGESHETFEVNLAFMKEVLSRGLLVRRINMRQVMVFPNTKMGHIGIKYVKKHKQLFKRHKEAMRKEVDLPMLRKVVPTFTVLRDVYAEVFEENMTWARQVGSYPILCAVPAKITLNKFYDLVVVNHGYRSVTALPTPLSINKVDMRVLTAIPGIGEKRAAKIVMRRPFKNIEQIKQTLAELNVPEIDKVASLLTL